MLAAKWEDTLTIEPAPAKSLIGLLETLGPIEEDFEAITDVAPAPLTLDPSASESLSNLVGNSDVGDT